MELKDVVQRRWLAGLMAILVLAGGALVVRGLLDDEYVEPWFDCETAAASPETSEGVSVDIGLERVAEVDGLTAAVGHPDGSVWMLTKDGEVIRRDGDDSGRVLDLRSEVKSEGYEQGLLGIAFSPNGSHAYLSYTGQDDALQVVEVSVDRESVDTTSIRVLLEVEQPRPEHNGGDLEIGPDGMLWASIGDGGVGLEADGITVSDFDHDRAQQLDQLHGTIVRLDPTPDAARAMPYSIPSDNPFADQAEVRAEIWAYGLRNPWRFTVDQQTGDLWIGDVGQYCTEEVNFVPASQDAGAGANFGWPRFEGHRPFLLEELGPIDSHVEPLLTYGHVSGGCSIVGGVVYRGAALPEMRGAYVFTDSCDSRLRILRRGVSSDWVLDTARLPIDQIVSIDTDADGEILLASLIDGVHRVGAP